MNCNICFEKYNKNEFAPTTCIPCGHTFCKKCIDEMKKQDANLACPSCRQRVQAEKPCFAIIGILETKKFNTRELSFFLK